MANIMDWTGISTPFRIENGSVAKSKSVINSKDGKSDHISESIKSIMSTIYGEWITRNIGTEFRTIIFNSLDDTFDTYIKYNLIRFIEKQDNRVKITEINIERIPKESLIKVNVKWDLNPSVIQTYGIDNNYETVVDILVSNTGG